MRNPMLFGLVVAAAALASAGAGAAKAAEGLELFETRVRPILAKNCYACHAKTKVANLRLDSREDMLTGGDHGPALVPGDADKSLLVKSIRHEGDLKMPKGGKLKQAEIDAIAEWVKLGAPWPEAKAARKNDDRFEITPEQRAHWAFQPLKKPAEPAVKDARWARNAVDRFVLAKLEENGLRPVAAADKRTLIRRAYYDLTGLPPAPEDVEAFVKDASPAAFEKVVDKLLASPAYGERWGRHWLDVTRFGEDDTRGLAPMGRGYEPYQFAYLYRDWVVRMVNDDLPYGDFVKAHLAADLMEPKVRAKMLPALGFLGQGPWYYDLTEPPVARADERHERVDVVTRGFLGLTVGCARCHDHKYDPISMKDYYGLAGVFYSTEYHEHALAPKSVEEEYKKKEKKVKDLEKALQEFSSAASQQLAEVHSRRMVPYLMAAWRVTGEPKEAAEKVASEAKLDLELLQRYVKFLAKPPAFYPYLKDWQAMIASGGTEKEAERLAKEIQALAEEIAAERAEIKKKNERMLATGTPEDEVKSIPLPNGFKSFFDKHQLELKTLSRERMNFWMDLFQRDLNEKDDQMDFRRFRPGLFVFRDWSLERQLSPDWAAHIASVKEEIKKRREELKPFPFVHGVRDLDEAKNIAIHLRGSPYSLGEETPRRFLEVLSEGEPKAFSKGSGRLELAEAIAGSPVAARVAANRIWKWHFGTGLVETPSNFGFAGERPSNPELLEWLAAEFAENGMSMKKLHKTILLSATYQLSGGESAENAKKDPANRLHWRFNRLRLDAEQIRDSLLSFSGTLDRKMYGPSAELGDDFTRRTVYGKVSRFRLDTYLALFDFPNPSISAEKRHSTNVPLQRLFFLNSPFVLKQAEAFARRLDKDTLAKRGAGADADEAKIREAYRILFQREALPEELRAGLEFLAGEKTRFEEKKKKCEAADPSTLLTGSNPVEALQKGAEAAAKKEKPPEPVEPWTLYAKILLSSNELFYIQ